MPGISPTKRPPQDGPHAFAQSWKILGKTRSHFTLFAEQFGEDVTAVQEALAGQLAQQLPEEQGGGLADSLELEPQCEE